MVSRVTMASGTRAAVLFQSIQYETQATPTNIDDGMYSWSRKNENTRFSFSSTRRQEYSPRNKRAVVSPPKVLFVRATLTVVNE